MQDLIKDFLAQRRFAVCGSFRNESKPAYRILKTLKEKDHEVFPVNPRLEEVMGISCYRSVKGIPGGVDVADIVTPPGITEKIVMECREAGIGRVWMQPGAESEKAINFCRQNNIKVLHGVCVMMESL